MGHHLFSLKIDSKQNAQITTVSWHSVDWQALWLMFMLFHYTTYCIGTGLLSDTWVGYVFVHLSGYNCIQKLHMGLAKHVHLSGFRLCTKHRAKVRGMENVCTYPGFTVIQIRDFDIQLRHSIEGCSIAFQLTVRKILIIKERTCFRKFESHPLPSRWRFSFK